MHDTALLKSIRLAGSQRKLASMLGVRPECVHYWKNNAKQIPYRYVLEIERITKGVVSRFELAPHEDRLNRYLKGVQQLSQTEFVDENSSPELLSLVQSKKISLSDAAVIVCLSINMQQKLISSFA